MDYLYFTLAIYFSLAVTIGFGLWLYLSTRKQIRQLRRSLDVIEQRSGPQPMTATELKAQLLELEGQEPQEIASRLGVPSSEVELALRLLKPASELIEFRA